MITSILINYEAYEEDGPAFEEGESFVYVAGEKKSAETLPNDVQAKFNANKLWTVANDLCRIVNGMRDDDAEVINAYVGIIEGDMDQGRVLFLKKIDFIKDRSRDEAKPTKYKNNLFKSAKSHLTIWPNSIHHMLLVLEFNSNAPRFDSDGDFLALSHFADIDMEALVFNEDVNGYVTQGYERGEYETGYFSNDGDECYLAENNVLMSNLQNEKFIKDLLN